MSRARRWLKSRISQAVAEIPLRVTLTTRDKLAMLSILAPEQSPIDRHIIASSLVLSRGLFDPSYEEWRIVRINKILEIFGIDFFNGKRLLELGTAHGHIGAFFAQLGAHVVALDGRTQNVNYAKLKHRKISGIEFHEFNLEHNFSKFGRFDLIINFGLLYHLKNVDEHVRCCFRMADDMLLETVVCDSLDPYRVQLCDERQHVNEEALCGIGSRPSPAYVERLASDNGFKVVRYFTRDLNVSDQFVYDWEHGNNDSLGNPWRLRRFWRLTKDDSSAK
jgi:SAM-dependent methyltransferase